MNMISFVTDMIALGSIPAYASLACMGIFVFYIVWHMLRGYRRGILRQLFHVAFVLISIVVSFIITNNLWNGALNIMDGQTVGEFVEKYNIPIAQGTIDALASFDLQIVEYIVLLPIGVVIMPFIFMVLFFVINLVLKLIYLLTVGIFHVAMGESRGAKIPGLILGIVEGFIVASVVLLPVAGVSDIADDAYSMITEVNEERGFEETDAEKMFLQYISPFSQNPVLDVIDKCGSTMLLDKLASFEDGDVTLNMRDEFASMVRFGFVDIPALKGTDWLALTEDDKVVLDDIVDFVSESYYKASIVSEMLGSMGQLVGKLEDSETDGSSDVILALFSVFSDLDSDSLPGVLNTFKEFYFLASDEGILKGIANGDEDGLTDAFTKKDENGVTTLTKIVNILESNDRTAVLVTTLTKMTITVIGDSTGLDENAVTKYNDIKGALNSAITGLDASKTKEEQTADISASLAESFTANGITVEQAVIDKMAENIVENHADGNELTDDEFNNIMLNYYQANKDTSNSSAQ